MNKQFATYKIALELKELGFDEYCLACYTSKLDDNNFNQFWYSDQIWHNSEFHPNPRICKNSDFGHKDSCTTPLWSQAISFIDKQLKEIGYVNSDYYILTDFINIKQLETECLEAIEFIIKHK